jgi:hypothetical protein
VVFLGGNGHSASRLLPARRALAETGSPFDILDVAYPGFEGRPRVADLEAFLDGVSAGISARVEGEAALLYATGIGGLLALCLRARGSHRDLPLLLQAPVLWGLERRLMPRLLRLLPAGPLLRFRFRSPVFQRGFARRHFAAPLETAVLHGFFEGYASCAALPDLFAWMDPPLLRKLEADLRGHPEALRDVSVWWGSRDRVVTLAELRPTERALGVGWPVRTFPDWGHYPMIDAPEHWVGALRDVFRAQGRP